eukprot:6734799-Pyramimonas_sp.AAC.1
MRRRQDDSALPTPGVENDRTVGRPHPWCGPVCAWAIAASLSSCASGTGGGLSTIGLAAALLG